MASRDTTVTLRLVVEVQPEDSPGLTETFASALAGHDLALRLTPPLYHLSPTAPLWDELRAAAEPWTLVTVLQARAARALLEYHGVNPETVQILSRQPAPTPEALLNALGELPAGTLQVSDDTGAEIAPRWYPVLDKTRCVECGHCHQFCLFGVYDRLAEGAVRVARPDQCKAGCPACARICPQSAILFPLYGKDAAISGAPGQFVVLDAEGRKLFYHRTGAPCTVCGQTGEFAKRKTVPCTECGRPLPEGNAAPATAKDELDALLDELEELSGG